MSDLDLHRQTLRALERADSNTVLDSLCGGFAPSAELRRAAAADAAALIRDIRGDDAPGLMEVFLAEYGLSTDEGVALMCLAEALLRVPDAATIDDLIEDKIAPAAWGRHLGHSSSPLVNASTWALMLTGKVLEDEAADSLTGALRHAVKRLGEPVIRTAVKQAMRELGRQFVLGETIDSAMHRAADMEAKGYTYSYDMLGEAALTETDAAAYFDAYAEAIAAIRGNCGADAVRDNPGISVKLSALHPRYEHAQSDRVMDELVPRLLDLCLRAKHANMGLNVDAEEADRLELSLDVIAAVVADPRLGDWDGFGVVVQSYGKRAAPTIDWLQALAETHDRRFMVRLVKGAYWDTEIKRAQVAGLDGYPVFERKAETDVSYVCCAAKLLDADRLYPQFATHNAHTVATVLRMADQATPFEFQRLHGMGESLYRHVRERTDAPCRIYAPVGAHRDLLAYLVRRLLENGANSSFVNQIVDPDIPAETVAADPFDTLAAAPPSSLPLPADLYAPSRTNAKGWDLASHADMTAIDAARTPFRAHRWDAAPLLAAGPVPTGTVRQVTSPADPDDTVGTVVEATAACADRALASASPWRAEAETRAATLKRAADLYETHFGELFALLAREAGKTLPDAIAELREAVDFLRYYAAGIADLNDRVARGTFVCISPWNFPLAIFTGQIAAALAAGNAAIAKPAEQTSLIAWRAAQLLHEAGVPVTALQLLPGDGAAVGGTLVGDRRTDGVCFTGSTATAQAIYRAMSAGAAPDAPLIAETGGINAMIVDSTALPEQAVKDIVASAFQSAGQRCSALRVLYVQKDIAEKFIELLFGAMDELTLGDPWQLSTDVGPAIDAAAKRDIDTHVQRAQAQGALLKQLPTPSTGTFAGPTAIRVDGIDDVTREVFGPVLHIATFDAERIDDVIADINASGYGLTFGLHTRIDDRVQHLTDRLNVGNIYINRNQIGAVVGSQPFGGEGLSGTGPKAGGPAYLRRFTAAAETASTAASTPRTADQADLAALQRQLLTARADPAPKTAQDMPGPTGESNRLSTVARGTVLCLGPTVDDTAAQKAIAADAGCAAVTVGGMLAPDALTVLDGIDAVAHWGSPEDRRALRQALAARDGKLVPLLADADDTAAMCRLERHVCIDTTASGGNASLLAGAGSAASP